MTIVDIETLAAGVPDGGTLVLRGAGSILNVSGVTVECFCYWRKEGKRSVCAVTDAQLNLVY
jgi:hypothetical protein